jgi:mevalonate kinase
MKKTVVARAPGKLILSGEYSVLYKMPAIAFAIEECTETTSSIIDKDAIIVELKDYNFVIRFSANSMNWCYLKTQERYDNFLSGLLPIEKVLETPMDLCCFIIGQLFNKQAGIKVSIKSTIPIASGFGSSAALIVSLIKSLDSLLCINLTKDNFYKLALEAENLVHGNSSGIDLLTSIIGGCNYFFNGNFPINSPDFNFFLIYTGRPEISSGESIVKVQNLLKTSDRQYAFKEVTLNLKEAFANQDLLNTMHQIRNNHLLLKELGVVPRKVQDFIKEIESSSGAAKICGSGAVAGENAGAVIALGNFDYINEISQRFNYSIKKVKQSNRGAYVL